MKKIKRAYESRTHGWLIDYEYELDQGPNRRLKERSTNRGVLSKNPVVVHVEIESMLDRISEQSLSASDAVKEIIKTYE